MTLDFETLQQLSRGAERIDIACPICGPHCKAGSNRTRKVLRIFNQGAGFCHLQMRSAAVKRDTLTSAPPR